MLSKRRVKKFHDMVLRDSSPTDVRGGWVWLKCRVTYVSEVHIITGKPQRSESNRNARKHIEIWKSTHTYGREQIYFFSKCNILQEKQAKNISTALQTIRLLKS